MDGVLYIKRNYIKFPYEFINDEVGLGCEIEIPDNKDDEIYELVKLEEVEPITLGQTMELKWSDIGEKHLTSNHSKWLAVIMRQVL